MADDGQNPEDPDEDPEEEQGGQKWSPFEHGESAPEKSLEELYPDASNRVRELLAKIRSQTRAGQDHREALLQTFAGYDTDACGELGLGAFHHALRTYLPARERVSEEDARLLL